MNALPRGPDGNATPASGRATGHVVLLLHGSAGVLGAAASGPIVDQHPRAAVVAPIVVQAIALLCLAFVRLTPIAIGLVMLTRVAFATLTTGLANRVLQVAPGRLSIASAGMSTAVNAGITSGALLG